MADKKISELTELTSVDVANDTLAIVDDSATETKKVAVDDLTPTVVVTEQASVSTPASGKGVYYFKTDGKPYAKDDAGSEIDLSATADPSADQNYQGNYMLNEQGRQNHVANTMPAPYYRFDGVDDSVVAGSTQSFTGDFAFMAWAYSDNWADTNTDIMDCWTTGANEDWYRLGFESGSLLAFSVDAGDDDGGKTDVTYDASGLSGWQHIAGVRDTANSLLRLYVNGIQVSTAAHTDTTAINPSTETAYGQRADLTNAEAWAGCLAGSVFYNFAPTAAEVKELYSGASVPYKYKGASQTEIVSNGTFTGNDTGWTSNAEVAYGTNNMVFTGGNEGYMYQVISATTAGKAYNLTYEIIANTLTGGGSFRMGVTNGAEFVGTTTLSTDVGVHNYTLIADGGTWIAFNTSSGYTGGALTLDNVSLTRSGAVAEYDGSGAGHGQWLDKSGNELHGDVSGASLENTGANHTEKYVDLTVTGDTSFTLPKGYRVSAVTTKETAGNALGGGMDIGTTNGGGEVVAAHAISANTTAIATIVAAGSIGGTFTTADDTLYITDADGTGWDSASVEVRVEMQRLTMN